MEDNLEELIEEIFGCGGTISDAKNFLSMDFISSLPAPVTAIMDTLQPIGILLVTLYWLIDIIEKTTSGQGYSIEQFVKSFVKLTIGLVMVGNCQKLCLGIIQFSGGVLGKIGDVGEMSSQGKEIVLEYAEDLGFFEGILFYVELLIPYLITKICSIIVLFISLGRAILLLVKCGFAPIGLADIFFAPGGGNGTRYIKGLLASGLQGAVILGILVIVVLVGPNITTGSTSIAISDVQKVLWMQVLLMFAMAGAVVSSLALAKEITGA